jgi:putative hydrolase of the HAD superfamily
MADVKAVLFDLDHTLYDRDATFLDWARRFVRERLGLIEDSARAQTVDLLVVMDASGYRPRAELFQWIKERYPFLEATVEDLVADFYREHVSYLSLEADTRLLLDALAAARIPLGVVTNGSVNQLLKVRKLGLDARTSCIHISELVGCRKPEPAIFLAAAEDLGMLPRDILFVGDNPEADIAGAATVGMRTAWLHRQREWPDHLGTVLPDYTIDSLAELLWITKDKAPGRYAPQFSGR